MKYMNMKKKFWSMDLQLFAGDGGDGADGSEGEDGSDGEDDDPDDDSEGDDAEEKKFTQKDVDDAVQEHVKMAV